jgi:hypothetical protein
LNAVEIEQAISELADAPFDPVSFPYTFLEAFGNKDTTIKRLRTGSSNKSDIGGVLQANHIHIATCVGGQVSQTLSALRASPATAKAKAKFILATDGVDFEAEELSTGETIACAYKGFPDHFGFFLPLAGITTVKQITENAFDIRATEGQFFIVGGQMAYIAAAGEQFETGYNRRDSRLRVIYDNRTESNLLMRSFQRSLYRDEAGRLITNPDLGPLFAGSTPHG